MNKEKIKEPMAKAKSLQELSELEIDNTDCGRPSYLEIDLDAFNSNFQKIKDSISPDTNFMAVVKANAYGHGIVRIGLQAEKCGVNMLGVAFIEEGERLLEAGIKIPIVVLYPDTIERAERLVISGLAATVDSSEYLESLSKAAVKLKKSIKIFIKAETGMGRFGASEAKIRELLKLSTRLKGIELTGIATNLADSNNGDNTFTMTQFDRFSKIIEMSGLESKNLFFSIENSSGFLYHHDKSFNLIRIGLLLYGVPPKGNADCGFTPVMSLKSKIIRLNKWPSGKPVGYGGSFIPDRDTLLAAIGLGYADGYPWSLSNKAHVLINGYKAPIVGKVCMDAIILDVTDVPGVKIGDEVILLGKCGNQTITAGELSNLAGSFPYELISGFTDRLPRIYKG